MPALLPYLTEAREQIEPSPDDTANATKVHTAVRRALETSAELIEMGIDTILIGSYARETSIRRIKDVDVFGRLLAPPADVRPMRLLDLFESVLTDAFGAANVERQARSIKIEFPEYDLSADAVPAVPEGHIWRIPSADEGWEYTNPLQLNALSSALNAACDNEYVPTVKLVRQTRREHLGEASPGGLYVEIATMNTFSTGPTGADAADYFCIALAGVAEQLRQAAVSGLPDPSMPGRIIKTRATPTDLAQAAATFANLALRARRAYEATDECRAAHDYQAILGHDPEGLWVYPMPAYCNDDGTRKSTASGIVSGSRRVPAGDSRFA